MTDAQAQAVAAEALAHWGGARQAPRLIANRENAVFRVTLADGARVALRLHRAGYQTHAAVRSELRWMRLLADAGFRCCVPVATKAGALTVQVGGRVVSMLGWLDGAPLGASGVTPASDKAQQVALFARLGAMIAQLHAFTDALMLPDGFVRPCWDENGLIGETPLWGRFWDSPALVPPERDLLARARDTARGELAAFRREGADFGLIHADILRENVLADQSGLALIDFDDCGFGFRMYDLGVALTQNIGEPHAAALSAALISGYRGERTLPDHAVRRLDMFIMLRTFASCGWIMTRAARDHEEQRRFAQRAVDCARAFLNGRD